MPTEGTKGFPRVSYLAHKPKGCFWTRGLGKASGHFNAMKGKIIRIHRVEYLAALMFICLAIGAYWLGKQLSTKAEFQSIRGNRIQVFSDLKD